jgi:hypothetical protein
VIKAIQTLGQVTLNEVIENLAALRDGKSPAPLSSEGRASVRRVTPPAPRSEAPRTAEQAQSYQPKTSREDLPVSPVAEDKTVDYEAVWQKTIDQIRTRRPLIRSWVESAKALGIEGRFFVLGFPPEQKTAMESVASPRTRDFLEALITEISGQDWKLKFILKEGLPVAPLPEPPATPDEAPARKKGDSQAMFKDDPLIREALEIFKGEIKTVSD